MRFKLILMVGVLAGVVTAVQAADATQSQIDAMRQEIAELNKRMDQRSAPIASPTGGERVVGGCGCSCECSGPNPATTKTGKLTVGGLLQIWEYGFQKDNNGIFDNAGAGGATGVPDSNETQDIYGYRVRRAQLKFTMDIHENVTGVVMIDPAREAVSYPLVTDNQANQSIFKRINQVAPEFDAANGPGLGSTAGIAAVQTGAGAVPRMLQDAYINYHGVVPHHDFQVGQFKPWVGEEGLRSDAQLDFVERSFLGTLFDDSGRDLGASVHGTWWDDRFQYWGGVFDGAGNYLASSSGSLGIAGQGQNRADDNNQKDVNARFLVRPLWDSDCECSCHRGWGKLELGGSYRGGVHGDVGSPDPIANPLNGLNRRSVFASEYNAWMYYAPGNCVRGLWLRGEWNLIHDRNSPNTVVDLQQAGTDSADFQGNPHPTTVWGAYGAIGYKLSESRWADCDCCWGVLKNMEFAFRYDMYYNVEVANAVNPDRTNNYKTVNYTPGINYYMHGHSSKIQLNYNIVRNPTGGGENFHRIKNDSLVLAYQVAF